MPNTPDVNCYFFRTWPVKLDETTDTWQKIEGLEWLEIVHCRDLDKSQNSSYKHEVNFIIDAPGYTKSETILLAYVMMLTNLIESRQTYVKSGFDIDQCRKDIASVFSKTFKEFRYLIQKERLSKFDPSVEYELY